GAGWAWRPCRFGGSGAALGVEFQVNTSTTGSDGGLGYGNAVALSMTPRGDFVVTWASYHDDGSDIRGRRFDALGIPRGGEFQVNTASGTHFGTGVAMNAKGEFVVTWTVDTGDPVSRTDVLARRYDASAVRVGGQFQVNTYTTGIQGYDGLFSPQVALADSGRFTVLWNSLNQEADESFGVRAQAFDAAGAPVGAELQVNTYTTASQGFFSARGDARGNVLATWQSANQDGSSQGVFAQRFGPDGSRRGAEFQVNTFTTGFEGVPNVGLDPTGNFDIVWHGPNEGSTGILLQRYGGLVPAGLVVDPFGNQALEPGESADVNPLWRNVNGAPQTFSGALSEASGPAGGVPTILDGTGDYGTVPTDTYVLCTDCYRVSVPDPPTRPATHWDGAVVESLIPDAQGQQKTWLLHVGRSFTDVPDTSAFYRFVETLLHNGVTAGCTATSYCPSTSATRDQMAVFVLVAKEGAGYT